MPARRTEDMLIAGALVVLVGQLGLLAELEGRPEAPADLPATQGPLRGKPLNAEDPAADTDHDAAVLLDQLLAQRVAAAATRLGVSTPPLPSPALRAAALADPNPDGPAVHALIDAYADALKPLGETLDATSTPAPATSPETSGPTPDLPQPAPPPSAAPASPAGSP